ncbi:hypothetical protein VitviT2T_009399 [Vitis vinifera]|uniref:Histone H2A n=2 Tax=Vitis vinifera TaxID=29760 RepID=A0ABY9C5H4_VITVI|eukprot:XP_019076886.1 PREDICTED: histone H2A-beta, sperm [Vitis vinifera]
MSSSSSTKAGKGRSRASASVTCSRRAGLQFPVGRISRLIKDGNYAERVSRTAPVYLSAVLEYLSAEVLELAGNVAKDNQKARILPRHIVHAMRNDIELCRLLENVTIADGGVLPNIDEDFLPEEEKGKGNRSATEEL